MDQHWAALLRGIFVGLAVVGFGLNVIHGLTIQGAGLITVGIIGAVITLKEER